MYFKLEDRPTVFVDVDDTLILWDKINSSQYDVISLTNNGITLTVVPNDNIISKLYQHKLRNHKIVVWSQGGSDWAEMVVKALNIEHLVDIITTKANWFYDDLPASSFMDENRRIYLK